jgi:hypothetical protein
MWFMQEVPLRKSKDKTVFVHTEKAYGAQRGGKSRPGLSKSCELDGPGI